MPNEVQVVRMTQSASPPDSTHPPSLGTILASEAGDVTASRKASRKTIQLASVGSPSTLVVYVVPPTTHAESTANQSYVDTAVSHTIMNMPPKVSESNCRRRCLRCGS